MVLDSGFGRRKGRGPCLSLADASSDQSGHGLAKLSPTGCMITESKESWPSDLSVQRRTVDVSLLNVRPSCQREGGHVCTWFRGRLGLCVHRMGAVSGNTAFIRACSSVAGRWTALPCLLLGASSERDFISQGP